jgi:hypothetical protein
VPDDQGDDAAARRAARLRVEHMAAVDGTASSVARRARWLAASLRYYADLIESGHRVGVGANGKPLDPKDTGGDIDPIFAGFPQMAEQVDDAWAAFYRTPSDEGGLSLRAEFDNLVRIGIVGAVESGARRWSPKWNEEAVELIDMPEGPLGFAVGVALEQAQWNYPEHAAQMNRDLLCVAIRAWARGDGPPSAGEPTGSKWEHLARLCESAGLPKVGPKSISNAWQKRSPG